MIQAGDIDGVDMGWGAVTKGEKWLDRGHTLDAELTVLTTYTQDRWTQSHIEK